MLTRGRRRSARGGYHFHYRLYRMREKRLLRGLPCLGLSLRAESDDAQSMPVAAWTDTRYIRESRMRIRLNAVTPAEPLHDAFILALLITLAQGQLKVLERSKGRPQDPLFAFRVRFLSSVRLT